MGCAGRMIWTTMFAMLACARPSAPDELPGPIPEVDGAAFVDPFIGTAGEGYTFPGAVAPWGMISISPHNLVADALDYVEGRPIAPAGYLFGEPELFGLGLTQLSGVGCPELGVPRISISTGELAIPSTEVGTAYENEQTSPGYYAVDLPDEGIQLEATVTDRAGILRASLDPSVEATLYVDAGAGLAWIGSDGHVALRSPSEIEGWARTGNFCAKGNEQRVHFALRLSNPSVDAGTWMDPDMGAWLRIDGASLEVRVGISYVSMETHGPTSTRRWARAHSRRFSSRRATHGRSCCRASKSRAEATSSARSSIRPSTTRCCTPTCSATSMGRCRA